MATIYQRADFLVVPLMFQKYFRLQKKLLPLVGADSELNMSVMQLSKIILHCIVTPAVQVFITLLSLGFTDLRFIRIPNTNLKSIGKG